MNDRLSVIAGYQKEFDNRHLGEVPFFEEISQTNVAALEHLVVCIAGELGELANVVKKVRRGDRAYGDAQPDIVMETTDIFIYVVKLANQMGFDLGAAYYQKMAENDKKFEAFER